jgi:hypothetical protein
VNKIFGNLAADNVLIDVIFNFFTSVTHIHQWLLKSPKLGLAEKIEKVDTVRIID